MAGGWEKEVSSAGFQSAEARYMARARTKSLRYIFSSPRILSMSWRALKGLGM